jgi:hypothetical protein
MAMACEAMTASEAALLVGELTGRSPSRKTLGRWAGVGLPTPAGRVKLRAVWRGGRRLFRTEDINEFLRLTQREV